MGREALCLSDGLIVDNFAGGGGASTGIEAALGRPIDIAINHDAEAVAMHRANHPDTLHYCQSVWSVDPLDVVRAGGPGGRHAGKPVALAWFSPDCKHFSKAKGGKPVEKHIRDLAWVVVHWVERLKPFGLHPRVIMLENVEEFQAWGPLTADNRPCPDRKGQIFKQWIGRMKRAGYKLEFRELVACNYGAPTKRKRFVMIARCDGQPIVWPQATHGPDAAEPWKTAADIIDWSIPCPSIFTRARPLKDATCRRIATGIKRFVLDAAQPFIVPVTHHGAASRLYDLNDPLPTVTAAHRGEMALIAPTLVTTGHGEREGQSPRVPGLHKPLGTVTSSGGHHALVAAFLAQHNTMPRGAVHPGRPADVPISTITARGTQQQVVTSNLVKLRNNCIGQDVREPIDTITTGGHFAEVRAFLVKYFGAAQHGQSCDDPLHTVTAKPRFGLVTCTIDGIEYAIADIGMRMLTARELFRAQGFPESYIIDVDMGGGRILPKTAQTRMCGNSVCPPLPEALVRANLPQLCQVLGVAA